MIDLTFLRPFSETLRDAESVEELWRRVCPLLPALLSFKEATLALADESGRFAEVRGSFCEGETRARRASLPWTKFAAGFAGFVSPHTPIRGTSEIKAFFFEKEFASALAVPLRLRLSSTLHASHDLIVQGALAFSHEQAHAFREPQRELLHALADLISVALVKIRKARPRPVLPLEQLIYEMDDPALVVDARGRIQNFSRGAEKLLGYSAEELLGRPALLLFQQRGQEMRRLLAALEKEGRVENFATELYRRDRSVLAVHFAVTRVAEAGGKTAGFLARLHSAWQQRAAEAELQRREKELENLIFVISHNLKTPLVSVQGFASLLRDELEPRLSPEHLHFLDRIQKNAGQMEKMVLDLLEFYRLGRESAKFEWADLSGVVHRVIDDLKLLEQTSLSPAEFSKPAAGEKVMKAEFVVPPSLPQIKGDANGLRTVFENLLSNAMKYRRPDAPLRIEIGWQEQPRFHAFWVRDNGMGVEAAFQQKAFNLFQRGSNVGKIAGTGVGLAIVRRIIENHRGMIKLDSNPGQGTSVYFTLPKLDQLGD